MVWLGYYSATVYAISLTLLMNGNHQQNHFPPIRYFISFLALLGIGILTLPIQTYSMIFYAGTLLLCFYQKKQGLIILEESLTAVIFICMATIFFGNPILFWNVHVKETFPFQIGMGLLVLFSSWFYSQYRKQKTIQRLKSKKAMQYFIFLEGLLLLFFSLILPQFREGNSALFYLMQWCFMLLLIVIMRLLHLCGLLEQENRVLSINKQQQRIIEQEYRTTIKLKHYFIHLVEGFYPFFRTGDLEGITEYFHQYIRPIHEESVHFKYSKNMKNVLIASVVESAFNRSLHLPIQFEYQIHGIIELDHQVEMDAFRILSEWLNNAMNALEPQKNGKLFFKAENRGECTRFMIENTMMPQVIKDKRKDKNRGYGIALCEDTILQNPWFTSLHEIRDGYYKQCLIVYHP